MDRLEVVELMKRIGIEPTALLPNNWSGFVDVFSAFAEQVVAAKCGECEKDAARYRWLRDRLHCADFCYGEEAIPVLVFHISKSMPISANLDKTLDDEIAKDAP